MSVYLINNNKKPAERTGRCGGNNRKSINANTVKGNEVYYPKSTSSQNSLGIKIKLD